MNNHAIAGLMLMVGLGMSLPASATLIDRGDGLIYDDVLDITWLQDASLGGDRTWDDAVSWADDLVFEGFDDWRLPSMDRNGDGSVVDCSGATESACRDNELGYMYYHNLGGTFGDDRTGDHGLIENIQRFHWSGTEFAPDSVLAWLFDFDGGDQRIDGKIFDLAAWAVRPGDVRAAPVPAPSTWLLLAAGLIGLGRWTWRRTGHG